MIELLLLVDELEYPDAPVREEAVVEFADMEPYGPPDYPEPEVGLPPVFDAVVWCESRGDPTAQNPVSSASGLYQFIDSTWQYVWRDYIGQEPPTARAYQASVADQHRAAEALYDREGLVPWYASRGCWG